jgi:hypothetical protein
MRLPRNASTPPPPSPIVHSNSPTFGAFDPRSREPPAPQLAVSRDRGRRLQPIPGGPT